MADEEESSGGGGPNKGRWNDDRFDACCTSSNRGSSKMSLDGEGGVRSVILSDCPFHQRSDGVKRDAKEEVEEEVQAEEDAEERGGGEVSGRGKEKGSMKLSAEGSVGEHLMGKVEDGIAAKG